MGDIGQSDNGIELAPGVRVASAALRIQFSRSAGPGGQNVNKVNTKAELWLAVVGIAGLSASARHRLALAAGRRITQSGELHMTCDTERTAGANRRELLIRLREMIVAAMVEPKPRRKTRATRGSKLRRLAAKRRRSDLKTTRRPDRPGGHDA